MFVCLFVFDTKSEGSKSKTKWDYIKLKKLLCTAREINKMKRQPKEWKTTFAIEETNMGLIFKIYIYKQLM